MDLKTICNGTLLLAFVSMPAFSAPFTNGTFDTEDAWVDASFPGSVNIAGGEAKLATAAGGSGLYSAVLVQGDDGFFNFSNPINLDAAAYSLNFDVRFVDAGMDAGESDVSSFFDYLSVSLYDELDWSGSSDLYFSSGNDFVQSSSWAAVSLDVSALAGHSVALSFELNDEDNGFDTNVFLDNVSFRPVAVDVPEPGTLGLLTLGLISLSAKKKRYI